MENEPVQIAILSTLKEELESLLGLLTFDIGFPGEGWQPGPYLVIQAPDGDYVLELSPTGIPVMWWTEYPADRIFGKEKIVFALTQHSSDIHSV